MKEQSKNTLRHLAELISQNKSLEEENFKLQQQLETITLEIERYRNLVSKYKIEKKEQIERKEKDSNILKYKLATVLFADAQGFSKISEEMDSSQLVDNLDEIFLELGNIVSKYEIKNLKSLGDSLLCVGGIPQKNITNPIQVVLAAIEMQYYLNIIQKTYKNDRIWNLRIGIHTGPVIAHISGRRKINYDIKGDSVNLATRIRSFCEKGNILISESTYEMVKDLFQCEYFTKMPVKYRGDMLLYYVKGIRPEYSLQKKTIIPNRRFSIRFGLIQFTDLQELMLNKLENELPQDLDYHNIKHTIDVVTQVELIGLGEEVNDEDLLLLKTAALFHDSGHILGYKDHERFGTLIAREILPDFYYTQSQIDKICELIMATQMPPKPKNKLEEIMCDADLDYLGRSDMIPVSTLLYKELKKNNKVNSWNEWNRLQIKFISNHQYFTKTAMSLREVNKQKQIERITNLLQSGKEED
ncbi:MAG: HD domain-containing protein [Bacteroidales bacterium]|nr:HD domain-containing protein [Bacteroidales bacterium]